jgi:hypothetical protein
MLDLQELAAFLVEQAHQREAPPIRVELRHVNGDDTQAPMLSARLNAASSAELELEIGTVARRVFDFAIRDGKSYPTPQDYAVCLLWARTEDEPHTLGAQTKIRVPGRELGALSPTEPATGPGQLAQLMRHIEAQARTNAGLVDRVTRIMADELGRKDARIAKLEADRAAQLETLEQLALHQHERQLAEIKQTREQTRLDEALAQLKLLAPPIVSAISKKLGGPQLYTADPEILNVKAWLKSLSHDQLTGTLARCTPAQQGALLHAYKVLALADEPQFADLAHSPASPSSPPDAQAKGPIQ